MNRYSVLAVSSFSRFRFVVWGECPACLDPQADNRGDHKMGKRIEG